MTFNLFDIPHLPVVPSTVATEEPLSLEYAVVGLTRSRALTGLGSSKDVLLSVPFVPSRQSK